MTLVSTLLEILGRLLFPRNAVDGEFRVSTLLEILVLDCKSGLRIFTTLDVSTLLEILAEAVALAVAPRTSNSFNPS